MKKYTVLLGVLFTLFLASTSFAASIPTSIKSARMEYNADKQIVYFSGKVHVTRPDFELWSDSLTLYLKKSSRAQETQQQDMGNMGAGDISVIEATNNVVIKSGTKEAKASKATYTVADDTFKLEGPPNPWLRDNKNTITGHTIYHYLKTNKSEVRGAVNATFFTPDHTEQPAQQDKK